MHGHRVRHGNTAAWGGGPRPALGPGTVGRLEARRPPAPPRPQARTSPWGAVSAQSAGQRLPHWAVTSAAVIVTTQDCQAASGTGQGTQGAEGTKGPVPRTWQVPARLGPTPCVREHRGVRAALQLGGRRLRGQWTGHRGTRRGTAASGWTSLSAGPLRPASRSRLPQGCGQFPVRPLGPREVPVGFRTPTVCARPRAHTAGQASPPRSDDESEQFRGESMKSFILCCLIRTSRAGGGDTAPRGSARPPCVPGGTAVTEPVGCQRARLLQDIGIPFSSLRQLSVTRRRGQSS